jgi:hypothetical protein
MKRKDKAGCDSHPSSSLFIFLLCLFSTPDFHNENCCLLAGAAQATPVTSTGSGNWDDAAIWSGGTVLTLR